MPMGQEICSKIKLAEIGEKFRCLSGFFSPPFNLNSIQISYFIVYSLFRRSTEFVLVSFFVIFSKRSVY